jgi:L-ascorbate metabolism protein UlaG (beta-lactamase superfamily)
LVLVTDIHGDHFDKAAIEHVSGPNTAVVGPKVVTDELKGAVTLANGETKEIAGLSIEAVPMYNLKRGPSEGKLFHDPGRGNGYLIGFGGKRIYLSGDTECTAEMKALENIDLAFVCMNLPYTMPPDEAAECVKAFRPKVVYPYHYSGSDLGVFQRALAGEAGIEVRLREWYGGED